MKLLIQLVREILRLSEKSQGISETSGCGNHSWADFDHYCLCRKLVPLTLVEFQFHCTIVIVSVKSFVDSLSCLRTVV